MSGSGTPEKVNIGVIGAGWWASQSHIPELLKNPHVGILAVNRPDAEGLARVAETFNLREHAYPDAAEMLAREPLHGVVVASPHTLHAEHARLAIERGLPVMVEKPMATSAADARALLARAGEKSVPIIMPYGWNYTGMVETAHRLVASGTIGEVRHGLAHMAGALGDLFAGQPMLETADHLFRPPPSTWADPARAGGFGWGQVTHLLGILFRMVDIDPVAVFAQTGLSPAGVDYFDAGVVRLANGATISLSGAATVPKGRGYQLDIRLYGTEGMLLFDVERARLETVRHDGLEHIEPLAADAGAYNTTEPIRRFVDLCRGVDVVNPADGLVGYRATAVLDALYRSAASGMLERA